MCGIDSPSYIEIDIGRVLEQDSAYQRCPVVPESPFIIKFIVFQCIFCIFHHSVHRDDAFGDQINAIDFRDRRNIAVLIECHINFDLFAQILRSDGSRRTSADDMLSLLRKIQRHHAIAVISISRRSEQDVHGLSSAYFDDTGGRIVTGLISIFPVALVYEHGCKVFG